MHEEARSTIWRWGIPLVVLATLLRLVWVLLVPTVPVGDFATYRESANFLVEWGSLDPGFIYMPGFVLLLAGIRTLGGELLAQKLLGVAFGGLAAAAVFGITARVCDDDDAPGARRLCPCPTAVVATLAYAVWPAGVAMSSVVGTDVPAAALIVSALALLVRPVRPRWAALSFGIVMGLAAYIRAVALPLTLLSAFFWMARTAGRRQWRRARDVAGLTALAMTATLIVLLPWGLRNRAKHGELFFTDCHGGITALIGANPNSEGTYTRALNRMFKDLTGRTVIDEPHRQTDHDAYALAKDWTRFELPYAAGLAALRADRLFAAEHNLLYWPIGRPGVLVGAPAVWFGARAGALNRLADGFWYPLVALYAAGLGLALVDRRWKLLALIPFQLALTATYVIFFAEPRYRLPIEMLAFPVAALALVRLSRVAAQLARAVRDRRGAGALGGPARAVAAAVAGIAIGGLAWPLLLDAGARLRADHRWAATLWTVDGRAVLAKWRRRPGGGPSPIAGAPNGVRITLPPGAGAGAAVEIETTALPAGSYQLRARGEPSEIASGGELSFALAPEGQAPALAATATLAGARFTAPGGPDGAAIIAGTLLHAGGPLHLLASLDASGLPAATAGDASLWLTAFELRRLP